MTRRRQLTIIIVGGALIVGCLAAAAIWAPLELRRSVLIRLRLLDTAAMERDAEDAWKTEFGDPAELVATAPPTEDSAAATRLVMLVNTALPVENTTLLNSMRAFVSKETTKTGGPVDAPPEDVLTYLEGHAREVEAVVAALLGAEPIVWNSNVSRPDLTRIDVQFIRRLQAMLSTRSLMQARAGDDTGVEKTLEAFASFTASLRDRPIIVYQLAAIASAHAQLAIARRGVLRPATSVERLPDADFRKGYFRALLLDARGVMTQLPARPPAQAAAWRADYLNAIRAQLVAVRNAPLDDRRKDHPPAQTGIWSSSIGGITAAISAPVNAGWIQTLSQLILDAELTSHVLRARAVRAKTGPRFPAPAGSTRCRRRVGSSSRSSGRRQIQQLCDSTQTDKARRSSPALCFAGSLVSTTPRSSPITRPATIAPMGYPQSLAIS
jgi:hypothetical protein